MCGKTFSLKLQGVRGVRSKFIVYQWHTMGYKRVGRDLKIEFYPRLGPPTPMKKGEKSRGEEQMIVYQWHTMGSKRVGGDLKIEF